MEVKLIPVIEIYCINEDVKMPKEAYEDYPAEWNQYHLECNRKAGFTEVLTEYLPGSSLYRAIELTPPTLKKLLADAVARMKEDEIEMDELLAFSGGFMLQVNGEVKLVPQCCSDLLAVHDWEELVNDYKGNFWQGHPEPKITVEGDIITFNLEQQFFPTLADKVVVVNRLLLKEALVQAKEELKIFAARLAAVEKAEGFGVAGIEKILVG